MCYKLEDDSHWLDTIPMHHVRQNIYIFFTVKASFNFHLKLHTGENPYQCNKCDKAFTHK